MGSLELTQEIAEEQGFTVDAKGFEVEMKATRAIASCLFPRR
jgi:alanyl-tRNA synthetase